MGLTLCRRWPNRHGSASRGGLLFSPTLTAPSEEHRAGLAQRLLADPVFPQGHRPASKPTCDSLTVDFRDNCRTIAAHKSLSKSTFGLPLVRYYVEDIELQYAQRDKENEMTTATRVRSQENPLLRHLSPGTVLTSSELIRCLKATGLSDDNARQLIRRNAARGQVWRSERLRLPKDERLFANEASVHTPGFFRAVGAKLLETNRRGLARCLQALGVCQALHKVDLMRLLAVSPESVGNSTRGARRLYEDEIAGLEEIGAVVVQKGTPIESVVAPGQLGSAMLDELAAKAAAAVRKESLLARILIERLRRQNLFSWNRVELPDPQRPYTVFNDQIFSSYGFSYLSPLVRWKGEANQPTPCPVLIDSYHGLCLRSHVHSFLQRIDRATIRGRSRLPSLGIIAARDFEREAWAEARRRGLMTVNFRQIFGDEALDAMVLVEELLHDLSKETGALDAGSQFEHFSELLGELKTNPVVAILRSIGFEAVAGFVLRAQGYEQVELGLIVPWEETKRDVDVFGFRGEGDELRVVECKAYHKKKSVPAEDVTKFFTETVPALKKRLREQGREFAICKAELWTTGPLGRDARDKLHSLPRPKGDDWKLLKGDEIQTLLPRSIKKRATELLNAIAMEDSKVEDEMGE